MSGKIRVYKMGCNLETYEDLQQHIGHKIELKVVGIDKDDPDYLSIECTDCDEMLVEFDNPKRLAEEYGYPKKNWKPNLT